MPKLLQNYGLQLILVGAVVLVEFLPKFLQERQLNAGYSQVIEARVINKERNLFGNARPATKEREKSCTLHYQYTFEGLNQRSSYRTHCDVFSGMKANDKIPIIINPKIPYNSKPQSVMLSTSWLTFGTSIGVLLVLLGVAGLLAKSRANKPKNTNG